MKVVFKILALMVLCMPLLANADTQLISNGGFETGSFSGWSTSNSGNGNTFVSRVQYSITGFGTPGPAGGSFYAVTDQGGPGSHSFSQFFTVTAGSNVNVSFDMFRNNQAGTGDAFCSAGLNENAGPSQCDYVDILNLDNNIVLNLVKSGSNTEGWLHYSFDLTGSLGGGGTFGLRFGEVDNQLFNTMAIDNVSVTGGTATPEPGSLFLLGTGLLGMGGAVRRKFKV